MFPFIAKGAFLSEAISAIERDGNAESATLPAKRFLMAFLRELGTGIGNCYDGNYEMLGVTRPKN